MKNTITKISLFALLGVFSYTKVSAQAGVGPTPYCLPTANATPCNQPNASNNNNNYINDFINSFNTTGGTTNITNNNSGCNTQNLNGSQVNYMKVNQAVTACPCQVITCNMQSGIIFGQGFAIWIDWNLDGIFAAGEKVAATNNVPQAASWVALNFTIPCTQPNGTYPMRVRCSYATAGTNIQPCGNQSYGETEDYKVIVGGTPIIVTAANNGPLCAGATLNLTSAHNSTAVPTFSWAGPNAFSATTQNTSITNVSVANAGTYTVFVTGACGTSTAVTTVVINPKPIPTAINNGPLCAGQTLVLTGGGGGTYNWSGPNGFSSAAQSPNIANVTTASGGVYTLTVTSLNGCTNTITTNVTINPKPVPLASSNSPVCVGQAINFSGNGGVSYAWSGPNGFTSNVQNPTIASAVTANGGVYTLTVTSAAGCTNTITTTVVINPLPVITIGSNSPVCLNQTINLTSSGGSTYSWSGPNGFNSAAQNPNIANAQLSMSGTYNVFVTTAAGCSSTASVNVTVVTLPQPIINSNSPICAGQNLNFTGSGGGTYSWTGPNGFSSTAQNPTIGGATTAASGTYSLIVTVGTCSNITTAPVTVNPLPVPVANNNGPVCLNTPINLTGSGGVSYSWSGPNAFTSNLQNPNIASATLANGGTYVLTATSAAGCTNTATTNLVVNPLPAIVVNNPVSCVGQALNFTSSGGVSYAWSGPNAFTSNLQNATINNAQLNMSGAYTVIVTSAQGCTNSAVSNASVITLPVPVITSNYPVCFGQTLNLTGSGGQTYSWTGPNGFNSALQNPSITNVSLAAGGTYSLVVAAGNCTNMTTANIVINPLPNPTAGSNSPVCASKQIIFTASGGVSYSWSGPNAFTSNNQNPSIASASIANSGNYVVTVTDANGCVNTANTNVVVNALPTITTNSPNVCLNQPINLTSTGGVSYAWSGPNAYTSNAQNPTITNAQFNMGGNYIVTVTSAQGCTNTAIASVSIIALPTAIINSNAPVCFGQVLNLQGSGGNSYSWTGPNNFGSNTQNPNINNVSLAANGTYSLIVSVGTCTNMTTANIVINPLPTPAANSNGPVCLNTPINFTGTGGASYVWTGPSSFTSNQQNPNISSAANTNAGTYTLTVTDANGCVNSTTHNMVVNPLPNMTANSPTACVNKTINLSSGGAASYSWSGPNSYTSNAQNPSITNAQTPMTGQYVVTGTTAFGCTATAVANVSVHPLPAPNITSNAPVCFGKILNLSGTNTNGGNATYSWVGPNGFSSAVQNPSINNVNLSATGVYTLVVTVNTCTAPVTFSATINPLPTPAIQSNGPVCLNNPITLTATGGASYTWSGPAGFTSSTQSGTITTATLGNAGTYTVTVTDANGCVNSTTHNMVVNPLPVIAALGSTVCANQNALLTANTNGGTSYAWSGPNGFTSTQQNPTINNAQVPMTGQYTVTVTNGNSCSTSSVTNVKVNSIPTVSATSTASLCLNQVVKLGAGTDSGVQFNWSGPNGYTSNSQNPSLNNAAISMSGNYTVVVQDNIGCTNQAVVPVTVNPLPSGNIAASSTKGCAPHCITFTVQSSDNIQFYNWNFGDGNANEGKVTQTCYGAEGVYSISATITDVNGCSSTSTISAEALPKPIADFNYAPFKPIVNNADITFTDASFNTKVVKWDWFFKNTSKPHSNEQHPVYIYDEAGTYAVALVVTDENGCKDTIVQKVVVGEDYGIYVPNIFTPNGDGLNDTFQPKGFGIVEYELRIFDRWGQQLMMSKDITQGWDGFFKDKLSKEDTYVWQIRLTNVFGKAHELTGHVMLLSKEQ